MPTSNESGFVSKVFHFDVEYHMTGYVLVNNWRELPIKQDFEGSVNVLHLLGNGVNPEGITILLVKLKGFFDGLRQFNANFMGPFQIMRVPLSHKRNNAVPVPQDMRNPLVESWFMVNAKDLSIFGCFNRVRLFNVSKVLPRCRAIFHWQQSCQPMVEHFRLAFHQHGQFSGQIALRLQEDVDGQQSPPIGHIGCRQGHIESIETQQSYWQ